MAVNYGAAHGALRVSARMFHEEVQNVEKQIRALVQGQA